MATAMEITLQLIDYVDTQEEAVLTYSCSQMTISTHIESGYLNKPEARSRSGGPFFLSNNTVFPPNNGTTLTITQIIKNVMSYAAEAELGALYIAAREAANIHIIVKELGHKQPKTPIQTDNSTAEGVINNKIQPKQNKAMDMQFYWLCNRECQNKFHFYWRPGPTNYADYWTKHHPTTHHKNLRK